MHTATAPTLSSPPRSFHTLAQRLSKASVNKASSPFIDIPWDDPAHAIDRHDPRFILAPSAPLATTAWYQALAPATQAELGLTLLAQTFKYGVNFEAVLSRGLLEYAALLPNGSPAFRYALHEVAEEANHSMMFQEFVNRSGIVCDRQHPIMDILDTIFLRRSVRHPTLFFFTVLAGEIFIDHENRKLMGPRDDVHPLVRRMVQIHVTEEARHVCFAEAFLHEHLPAISDGHRRELAIVLPLTFAGTGRKMLEPTRRIIREFAIPETTLREAFGPGTPYRAELESIVAPIIELCAAHGLYDATAKRMWRFAGLVG